MKEYKNILFDLDMTLLDFNKGEFNALKRTFERYGIEIDGGFHSQYSAINQALWKKHEKGELDKKELSERRFSEFLEIVGLDRQPLTVDRQFKDNLSKEAILMDGVFETCRALNRKYDLYIITNGTDYIQRSRISKSGIEGLFKGIITSDEAGAPKPKRQFFDYLFRTFAIEPAESLIVGDSLSSDISGGVDYGIDTCLIGNDNSLPTVEPTYRIACITELLKMLK